ncbi:MAG: hypothetical protein VX589_12040 [Myxococcota bacterium]|nr:hypothetical protein [Myxococcota bacterium]
MNKTDEQLRRLFGEVDVGRASNTNPDQFAQGVARRVAHDTAMRIVAATILALVAIFVWFSIHAPVMPTAPNETLAMSPSAATERGPNDHGLLGDDVEWVVAIDEAWADVDALMNDNEEFVTPLPVETGLDSPSSMAVAAYLVELTQPEEKFP